MKINKLIALGFVTTLILSGCKGTSNKSDSLTGWKDNDIKGWYFSGDKDKGEGGPGMVFVEGGTFTKGQTKDNVMHDWNNTPNRQQVRSFYISETEVTNKDYKMYLAWLRLNFSPTNADYKNIYYGALPDTMVWRNKLSNSEMFVENYLRSPEYDNYPVVGVNWLQASNYCEWLTDRVNEKKLMDEGIINNDLYTIETNDRADVEYSRQAFSYKRYKEKGTKMFGDESEVFTENTKKGKKPYGNYKTYNEKWRAMAKTNAKAIAPYRLPTETEWEFAALALKENREYNKYKGKVIPEYEWRNKKRKYIGNIKQGDGDYSGIAGYQNDGYALTSPVKAHKPNDLGIYGMFGNASEWTADVYRPIIDNEASDFNYYRGNTFKKTIRYDGQPEIVGIDIEYDTLRDGRMVYRELPGQIKEEVYDDAKNFGDGDASTTLGGLGTVDGTAKTEETYNSPQNQYIVNEDGSVKIIKDGQQRTSEISDKTRVIKGASWNDLIYWMDPAQRRFLDEREAASWIGFRVAQDRLGSDVNMKRSARGKR